MKTKIPFQGFYNSVHDMYIDDALESAYSDDHGNVDQEKFDDAFSKIDFKAVHEKYAKTYTEEFSKEFNIKLKFSSLWSPKYYNYETDEIICEIELSEVERIFNETNDKNLRESIRDKFTSCSGFISHYKNDLDLWPKNLEEWDMNQVYALIDAYVNQECDFHDKEIYLVENTHEMIYEFLPAES